MDAIVRGSATCASRTQFRGQELFKLAEGLRDTLTQFKTGSDEIAATAEVTLSEAVPVEIRKSFERIGADNLVEAFYPRFLKADPRIAPYFANTDMAKQKGILKQAFVHALQFAAGVPESVETVGFLGETHCKSRMNILPELYTVFLNTVLETLSAADPQWNKQLESAWRSQLQPVANAMISRYDAKVAVTA